MRRIKKRVKWWVIVLVVIVTLASINVGGNYIISERNYEHNVPVAQAISITNFDNEGYLNNISALSVFHYSLNHSIKNYSHILGTYNALNYLKRQGLYTGTVNKTIFPEIIKYYDLYAQVGFGHFGVNPLAVMWYFKSLGLKADIAFDRENIVDNILSSSVSILYRNGKTSAGVKDQQFRALTVISQSQAQYYGPNQSFHIGNRINIEYKNYFLALITINIQ